MNAVRRFLVSTLVLSIICLGSSSLHSQEAVPTPDAALKKLKAGNDRFVAEKLAEKDIGAKRRITLAKGQHPFAIILTCADSRVAPELVFDQGLGDLFVLRVAGNITDSSVLGSIEYAVEHLHVGLIAVVGHEKCGAVAAAVEGGHLEGNLGELIKKVHTGDRLPEEKSAAISAGVLANAAYHARQMTEKSTVLKEFAGSQRIKIVAGVYSLSTGKVEWIDDSTKKDKQDSK